MDAPTIETERLTLRGFVPQDTDAFTRVMADKEVWRDLWGIPGLPTDIHEHAEWYVSSSIESWRRSGYGFWSVWTRSPILTELPELIGFCGFVNDSHAKIHPPDGVELGWGLHPKFHKKGLAFESAKETVEYGFRDLRIPKQVATTNPNNTASGRLMERLGLSHVGLSGTYGGESVLYEITREQFEGFAAKA
ncbi:GNAT family N-acetyltransferase [Gammaproteobacteria bacterium]|nr:GNAT family N-acetyltransferase [Gammaproteobacteria bacterium]